MQLDWHDLQTNGCPALLRALKQIETGLTQQAEEITELQYLISDEIMRSLAPSAELPEIVEELGHGWRIIRQPCDTRGETTTVEDIDRQMAGVRHILESYQRAFIQEVDTAKQSG
jgi:hypothetical protein